MAKKMPIEEFKMNMLLLGFHINEIHSKLIEIDLSNFGIVIYLDEPSYVEASIKFTVKKGHQYHKHITTWSNGMRFDQTYRFPNFDTTLNKITSLLEIAEI